MARIAAALTLAAPLIACFVACGNGGDGTGGGGGPGASVCATDPRAMTYAVGLQKATTDGAIEVAFMDAMPAPPSKGDNVWTMKLTGAGGSPLTGAKIAIKPFMPDHGHGSPLTPVITPMAAEGMYQVTNLSMFMAGVWEFTFTVTPPGGAVATVVFTFCVDG